MALIDTQLPTLLGDALIEPSGPGYPRELQVVAELREGLTAADAVRLVGYAHGADGAESAQTMVAEAVTTHAPELHAGSNLSRRLAAAALIDLMQAYRGPGPVAAALAAGAAAQIGLQPVVPDLTAIAAAARVRLADTMRAVSFDRGSVQPFPPGKSGDLPPDTTATVTSSELRGVVSSQRTAIRGAATNVQSRLAQLEHLTLRNSEEIDLLWWSLEPFSDDVEDWHQAQQTATLLAALEVRRRLLIDPPPRGARRVLAESLSRASVDLEERLSLEEVVAEVPESVLHDDLLAGTEVNWATPVLSALRGRREGTPVANAASAEASRLDWAQQLLADLSLARVNG